MAPPRRHAHSRIGCLGANVYGIFQITDTFELRFEGYFGQNLANLGALALGQGSEGDVREVGGYLSGQ